MLLDWGPQTPAGRRINLQVRRCIVKLHLASTATAESLLPGVAKRRLGRCRVIVRSEKIGVRLRVGHSMLHLGSFGRPVLPVGLNRLLQALLLLLFGHEALALCLNLLMVFEDGLACLARSEAIIRAHFLHWTSVALGAILPNLAQL